MTDTFTCDGCGRTYQKGWTDEEAKAEYAERFPGQEDAETATVCDDCDRQMREWFGTKH